jgi:zinc-binding alcohol dehydrogenase family protein
MKAIGFRKSLPIAESESLIDLELPAPEPGERDLVVEVRAVSVNPVDTKMRMRGVPAGETKILGFDAAGVVKSVGKAATLFKPGDEVFYAGSNIRPGTNAELHAVDERIVGRKPKTLSFAQAAAMPLTSITAWELLFDRFRVARKNSESGSRGSLLVIGGAGGVGSMMIQFARKLTGLTVIATASRPETIKWCTELGAHHIVDHAKSLPEELKRIGVPEVTYVASLTQTAKHYPSLPEIVAPQGAIGLIDDPGTFDMMPFKRKCASVHWEAMFTRSMFMTPDIQAQHVLLNEVSALVEAGVLRTTMTQNFGAINAANLKKAHAQLESGTSIGKVVLEGF